MGGNIGEAIAEAGLGFMQGYADTQFKQQMQRKATQDQFAFNAGQELANRGELNNLPSDMLKPLQRMYGKEGFAQLMQLNQVNQARRNLRLGAERTLQAPIIEEQTVASPYLQGPVTPEGAFPKTVMEVARKPTEQEQFQRFEQMSPLGVYLATGDIQAGQLAQQQANQTFEAMKYAEAPQREIATKMANLEEKFAGENRKNYKATAAQIDEIRASNKLPPNMVAFKIGDMGMVVEVPELENVGEDVSNILRSMGVYDARNATPEQFRKAHEKSIRDKGILAGMSANVKAKAERDIAENSRLWDISKQRAESTFDVKTGQLAPASLTVKDADSPSWKVIPDQHRKVLQEVQQSRASMEGVVRDFQKLYGKGGELANIKATLPSRGIAGAKAYWNTLTQQNPTLAALKNQAGQIAQALNRGSYGGVGTQTENDRKYAIKALTSVADGSFLVDTPEVQQKKINSIVKRFNDIEGTILGNRGQNFPGTVYMDITKPATDELPWASAPITAETPAEAPQQIPGVPDKATFEKQYPGQNYEEAVKAFQELQSGQKKNPEVDQAIQDASTEADIPVEFLQTMSQIESGGDPEAVSPTGATGLFQFTKGTGQEYGLVGEGFDNRMDPVANARAAAAYAKDNFQALQRAGIAPEPWLLYMAHQQGVGGVKEIVRAAQEGTKVSARVRRNMDLNGGKGMDPQEFLDMWERKWTRAETQTV